MLVYRAKLRGPLDKCARHYKGHMAPHILPLKANCGRRTRTPLFLLGHSTRSIHPTLCPFRSERGRMLEKPEIAQQLPLNKITWSVQNGLQVKLFDSSYSYSSSLVIKKSNPHTIFFMLPYTVYNLTI